MNRKNRELLKAASVSQQEYVAHYYRRRKYIRFCQIDILLFFILFWEAAVRLDWINGFIFSSPVRLWNCLVSMLASGELLTHLGVTVAETLVSFVLIMAVGLITAILLWWNESFAKITEPYLVVLNSLPKSALAPVFIVWLGNNPKTIIVAAVSVALFGTIISLSTDFREVDPDKVKLIRTLGGVKKDVLWKVVLPANLPGIVSIMKVDIGLALVGVIIGEFLAARAGLGYLIVYGSQVFKLDWVILSIVLLCILATALYGLLTIVEKKFVTR